MRTRKPLYLETLEPRCMLSTYSVVDLGFLPDTFYSYTSDINNAGQIVGSSGQNAMLWTAASARDGTGAMTDLGVPTGYDGAEAKAISSNAWIAGLAYRWDASTTVIPCVWIPESATGPWTMQMIGVPSGQALGVNSQGKVVGVSGVDLSERAFVWEQDALGGTHLTDLNVVFPPELIPELAGSGTFVLHEAKAINDGNQLIANGWRVEDADQDGRVEVTRTYGFLLEDDDGRFHNGGITVTNLGSLGTRQYTYAADINNLGQVVGSSASARPNQGSRAFLWENGVMRDLGTLPKDPSSSALGISDVGSVVGYSGSDVGNPQAFVWQNGRMSELNSLIPADSGWTLDYGYAVNNRGEVVGQGVDPHASGRTLWRGFLLSTSVTLPTISIGDVSVTEGDSGTTAVQLEITLSESASRSIYVDYYTTGYFDTSIAGQDFITATGTVTFAPGQTSQVVTVQVKGDLLAGGNTHEWGDEFFYVNLINPRDTQSGSQTAVFLDAQAKVTIVEDEPAMSISDVAYPEGNEGLTLFTFTVLLSVPAKDTVTVHWHTGDNTAKAGEDYNAAEGDLVIPKGGSSGTFTVQVKGDRVKEDWEVFGVQLEKATVQNAYIPDLSSRTGGFAWGRIENDDRVTKPIKPNSGSTRLSIAEMTGVAIVAADESDLLPNARQRSGLPPTTSVRPKDGPYPTRNPSWIDPATAAARPSDSPYAAVLAGACADDDAKQDAAVEDQLLEILALDQVC